MTVETMRWYAVRTLRSSEERALANLKCQNFEVFAPRILSDVRQNERRVRQPKHLFAGYVFVKLDASRQRWRPVDSTFGVASILKVGGVPAPLPVGVIERLMSLTNDLGIIEEAQAQIRVGDRVRVSCSPFDDWIGEVLSVPETHRIVLLVNMASRNVRVSVPSRFLTALEQPRAV